MDSAAIALDLEKHVQKQAQKRRTWWISAAILGFFLISIVLVPRFGITIGTRSQECLRPYSHDVLFEDVEKHAPKDEPVNAAWDSLLTSNGGFLINHDDEGHSETMGISMFHQLHCLQMIRVQIENLIQFNGTGDGIGGLPEFHKDHVSSWRHWRHCLEYIRQVRLSQRHPLALEFLL